MNSARGVINNRYSPDHLMMSGGKWGDANKPALNALSCIGVYKYMPEMFKRKFGALVCVWWRVTIVVACVGAWCVCEK